MNKDSTAIGLAEAAIRCADKAHPADQVLRTLFLERKKGSKQPLPSAEASRLVFQYYRWRGWLDLSRPLPEQIRQAAELAQRFRKAPGEFAEEQMLKQTLPEWIGQEVALSPALLRAFQAEPRLWLRARRSRGPQIARQLRDCEPLGPGPLADVLHYFGREDVFRTPEYQAGDIQIQDVSSQAVGLLCNPASRETWWDACAGEGGKTLHLSELMEGKGLIWASDRSDWRLRRLRTRAGKAKVFNYRAALWDGGPKLPTRTRFDGVLVDAPCSGVGTWHRNPHARWTTTMDDVRDLAGVQLTLLEHAAATLKPGGKLIYSVCTLTKSETEAVADAFEQKFPQLKPLVLVNPLAPGEPARARHWFWPQDVRGNGMFVAAWR